MKRQQQRGSIFEHNGSWHIRYYVHEDGVHKRHSRKLCDMTESAPSKDCATVVRHAERFMTMINEANALNDAVPGHNCPICGHRCPRTLEWKFAKREESKCL